MKVLIADDEAVSRRLLESSLRRWGYEVIVAQSGLEASKILMSPDAPKLAVLDWMMPDLDGIQICQMIRRNKPEPYTYVLLLTGKRTQSDIVAGLEAGADDYVTKPFDAAELKVRLRTGKRILYLQEQLISARESLRDQATHDPLTELWNRAAILEILSSELGRAQRQGASVGISMVDLDHFKAINDTHGHQTGDEVLRRVSQALHSAVRRYDSVGRYGGEEFIVVMPGCDVSNALAHAERLRKTIAAITIQVPSAELQLTASLGVTVYDDQNSVEAFDLIQAADMALYRAKHDGRNRVEFGTAAVLPGV
jgi:diguanylate cyclase (GGDEF)-like protein